MAINFVQLVSKKQKFMKCDEDIENRIRVELRCSKQTRKLNRENRKKWFDEFF